MTNKITNKLGEINMTDGPKDITQRKAAKIVVIASLITFILAPFAYFYVLQSLIVSGDASITANNILASWGLFRTAICILLIVIILDVVIAWAFYVLLKPVNKSISLLSAWFRLIYSTIFGVALANLFNVYQLLSGADYLKVFETDQLYAQVMLSLNAFDNVWAVGYVFFSFHLALLGYLVFKSGYIPRILGVLLVVSGIGYLTDELGKILLSNYDLTIAMFTFIGELLIIFWLLIKGAKIKESNK